MANFIEGKLISKGYKICIVASRFNDVITSKLIAGALDALKRTGTKEDVVDIYKVPGSFEIPLVAKKIAMSGKYDGIICLGAVIRGETPHFNYVSAEVSKGIAQVMLETKVPVGFGIITADTIEQALDRAGLKSGNKGFDAAMSVIEMVDLFNKIG